MIILRLGVDTAMAAPAREAALKAIGAYRQGSALPDKALDGLTDGMEQRDSALAKQIMRGVLQNLALCDYYIAYFSTIKLKKLEPRILDILRISVYQIVFLTKIPRSAAVNEGVALANRYSNRRAASYVNAVLRKVAVAAENGNLPPVAMDAAGGANLPLVAGDAAGSGEIWRMSIEYSHPAWLVGELAESLGMDGARAFLKANNDPDVPVTAQVNTLLADTDAVLASLKSDGVRAKPLEWLDDCVEMRGSGAVNLLDAYKNGHIYIQDPAARLAVMAAEPAPGMLVIDGCAAPGGKSFAAAISMRNTGRVVSCDISEQKLRKVVDGAKRLGIGIITVSNKDATAAKDNIIADPIRNPLKTPHISGDCISCAATADNLIGKADIVFADVPCSGTGVIRKKPEIRYKTKNDIAGLPDIQKRILHGLSSYVKPGGTLIYSTCSILRSENEDVINCFLAANSDFRAALFSLPRIGLVQNGLCTLLPNVHGTDGFFICKLVRH